MPARTNRRVPVHPNPPAAVPPVAETSTAGSGDRQEAAARVLRQFRLVFNAVKIHFQQVEKVAGIGGAQCWALSLIAAGEGMGVTELARAMDIHQSTASNLVKTLITRGLAEANRAVEDRRTVQLRVTAAGRQVLAAAPVPFTGVLPQALARLDPATLERLEVDLARLITTLAPDEGGARVPLGL